MLNEKEILKIAAQCGLSCSEKTALLRFAQALFDVSEQDQEAVAIAMRDMEDRYL